VRVRREHDAAQEGAQMAVGLLDEVGAASRVSIWRMAASQSALASGRA
jgi:hypothetical protein